MVIVDGNNVIGSVPDGWWRDRPAAVHRLLARLVCLRRQADAEVILVLDVMQKDLPAGDHDGVAVYYPQRPGRNAADGKILELLDRLAAGRSGQAGRGADVGDRTESAGSGGSHDTESGAPADGVGGHEVMPERPGLSLEIVTSDRALAASAAQAGATVVGARTFLARLDDLGC